MRIALILGLLMAVVACGDSTAEPPVPEIVFVEFDRQRELLFTGDTLALRPLIARVEDEHRASLSADLVSFETDPDVPLRDDTVFVGDREFVGEVRAVAGTGLDTLLLGALAPIEESWVWERRCIDGTARRPGTSRTIRPTA